RTTGDPGSCRGPSMPDALLVLNAGSSSLKFSLYAGGGEPTLLSHGQIEGLVGDLHRDDAVDQVLGKLQSTLATHTLRAVGHRVVHGGVEFTAPVRIDAAIFAALGKLVPLAPLHQPHNLAP